MYRRGIVHAVDPATGRARVRFPDRDNVVSWWLDVLQRKTHVDKAYWMPDVGEHVACLMDGHDEAGAILGALYSTADPVPVASPDKDHTLYGDGAVISYDRAAHVLTIDLSAAEGTLVLKAKNIVIKTGEGGFYHLDHHGKATRITHLEGAEFKAESWQEGAVTVSEPDYGYAQPEVGVEEEE